MNRNEDRFVVAVPSHDDIVGHICSVNNFTLGASSSIEVAYYMRSLGILSTKEPSSTSTPSAEKLAHL